MDSNLENDRGAVETSFLFFIVRFYNNMFYFIYLDNCFCSFCFYIKTNVTKLYCKTFGKM